MCWGDSLACACVAGVTPVFKVSFVFFLTEEERRRLTESREAFDVAAARGLVNLVFSLVKLVFIECEHPILISQSS